MSTKKYNSAERSFSSRTDRDNAGAKHVHCQGIFRKALAGCGMQSRRLLLRKKGGVAACKW